MENTRWWAVSQIHLSVYCGHALQASEPPSASNSRTSSFKNSETSSKKLFSSRTWHFMFLIILKSEVEGSVCRPPIHQHLLTAFGLTLSVFFFFFPLKKKILIESPTEKLSSSIYDKGRCFCRSVFKSMAWNVTDRVTHADKKRAPLEELFKNQCFYNWSEVQEMGTQRLCWFSMHLEAMFQEISSWGKYLLRAAFKDTCKSHRDFSNTEGWVQI